MMFAGQYRADLVQTFEPIDLHRSARRSSSSRKPARRTSIFVCG